MGLREASIAFVKEIFRIYLEGRDFVAFSEKMDKRITWIGTGKHEICHNYEDALRLLSAEGNSWDGKFKILDSWYEAVEFSENLCLVMGELRIQEDGLNVILMDMHSRVSMFCIKGEDGFRLLHAHFSVPNEGQQEDEFVHKNLVKGYNLLLEQKLEERTKMLKYKNEELLRRNEELLISEKRYQIAVQHSNAFLYDYIISGDVMIFPEVISEVFELPHRLEEALQAKIWNQVIHPNSVLNFYVMHEKIKIGNPMVKDTLLVFNRRGEELMYEFALTNIFDEKGEPVRAVGILQDVTKIKNLEKEKQYRQVMTANRQMPFEANITRNMVTETNLRWAQENDIPKYGVYTDLIDHLVTHLVHPSDQKKVRAFYGRERFYKAIKQGEVKQVVQYQRISPKGYIWVENEVMIIRDAVTNDVRIRCYTDDISKQKETAGRIAGEQRIYELMIAHSIFVYENNLTTNQILKGHEQWPEQFGIETNASYSDLILTFAITVVYEEDIYEFLRCFAYDSIMQVYKSGKHDIYCEYRRKDANNNFIWVSCTMHLYEDTSTKELHAVCYVQDIHEKKLKQLELLYRAEHDQMTGLLNKTKTEQAIEEYLSSEEGKAGHHVFYIFDLDHFKLVNDTLGHIFGDTVISRIAVKVKELFRDDDILGRIGGDEFAVLVKNISNEKTIEAKGWMLCERLRDSYTNGNEEFPISASVGAAWYPRHGKNFQELYKKSDIALYASKTKGRDSFSFYQEGMGSSPIREKEIDKNEWLEIRSYEGNISEYVFRILYESLDKTIAIQAVLELIGKQFHISRAYIFEDMEDSRYSENKFEWCNLGIAARKKEKNNILYSDYPNYKENFNELGIFYLSDSEQISEELRGLLKERGAFRLLQFAILKKNCFAGFVGFDFCGNRKSIEKETITILKIVANMIGVFLAGH